MLKNIWNYLLKSKIVFISIIPVAIGVIIILFGVELEQRIVEENVPSPLKEIKYKYAHLRCYRSSVNPDLRLWTLISLPLKPSYILVTCHGWHGGLSLPRKHDSPSEYLMVEVDMRGRSFSDGKPDLSGWELQDWIDAVEFVRKEYSEHIIDPECVYAEGGSGSGGNVYALIGKFPDFLTAAAVHAGMSDYTLLYNQDQIGEFRDEMEGEGWIGGSPITNPEGYISRGGLTTVENILTPIHIDHGETDIRVPVAHARRYVEAARAFNKEVKYLEWPFLGDRRHWTNMTKEMYEILSLSIKEFFSRHRKPPQLPLKGRLTVAGYVKTRYFELILEHIDRIGWVDYEFSSDYTPKFFRLNASTSPSAILRVRWPGDEQLDIQSNLKKTSLIVSKGPSKGWVQIEMKLPPSEVVIELQ